MTNGEKFKEVFGYEPITDSVVCNKDDWCGASEPCNYCMSNPNNIGREEDWWNAEYKEPTIKNDLGVDCISRNSVLTLLDDYRDKHFETRKKYPVNHDTLHILRCIRNLPSVTPQPCEDAVSRRAVLDLIADYDLSMGQVVRGKESALDWLDNYLSLDERNNLIRALQQEPRWIPTSERLPNKNQWVLVTTENYQKSIEIMCYEGTRIGRRDVGNGWEEYEYPSWTSGHVDIKSSHPKAWMPLPKSHSEVKE